LLELPYRQVGRGQVAETLVDQGRRGQFRPVTVLDAPGIDARAREGGIARRQIMIPEQGKARLAVQDAALVEQRDSRIVQV